MTGGCGRELDPWDTRDPEPTATVTATEPAATVTWATGEAAAAVIAAVTTASRRPTNDRRYW